MPTITADQTRTLLAETAPGTQWAELAPESSLADAGLDSLDKVTFIMKVEEATGLSIPDDAYEQMDSIDSVIAYVSAAD